MHINLLYNPDGISKLILTKMYSPKLAELIQDNEIKFPLENFETMYALIQYLYTGQCHINEQNYKDLIRLSDKYELSELKSSCFEVLINLRVTPATVCSFLLDAISGKICSNANLLVEKCMNFIAREAEQVFSMDDIVTLPENIMLSLIQSDDLCISEIEVWKTVMKWGTAQLKKTENKDKKLKDVISQLIPHIRYPLIESDDLVKIVKPSGLVPQELYTQAIEASVGIKPRDPNSKLFKDRSSFFRYCYI